MNMLFYLAVILLAAIFTARILGKFKLPNVTGYLVAGLFLGPSILGIIPENVVGDFAFVSEIALAFIAYNIGSAFNITELKKLGSGIMTITIFQAAFAMGFVTLGMMLIFGQPFSFSLVLGAISCATAPAATVAVIRQYKAKGEVVDTLIPVVAIDDAICIIVFGVSASVAKVLMDNAGGVSIYNMILSPLIEVVLALGLGVLMGAILVALIKRAKGESELLTTIIGVVLLTAGISLRFDLSSLLSCMMVGAVIINVLPNFKSAFTIIDRFTPAIYIAFFTISGMELDLSILKTVGAIGLGYIVLRTLGKLIGTWTGAKISNASDNVRKYLGFTLIPQAGVAIGLSMVAQNILPEPYGSQIRTIVLAGTVIFELVGPLLTKKALIKAGEIKVEKE